MSLAVIILPTNKTDSIISDRVRKIGQREKGLELEVIVTDANNEGYDLSDKIVTFSENKVGGKIVSDSSKDHIQILNAKDGRFKYKLAEAVYAASGEAWFDISSKDGEVVDTTKSFDIDVIENAEIHINNDNYVSTLIDLETYYKAIIQRTDQQTAEMVNKYNGEVGQLLDSWKTQSEQINKDYEKQKEGLASDAQAEIAKIEKDKQAAIDAVNQGFKDKLSSIQDDYDKWKQTTATDFEERIDKVSKDLETAEKNQADMKETIDSAMEAVDKIKGVDFTKYVNKDDFNAALAKINTLANPSIVDNKTDPDSLIEPGVYLAKNGFNFAKGDIPPGYRSDGKTYMAVLEGDNPDNSINYFQQFMFQATKFDYECWHRAGYKYGTNAYYTVSFSNLKDIYGSALKQISVNGGTPISPDDKGVATIDLTNYETKEDAETLSKEINKRPLTVNNVSPDDKGNISLPLPKQLVQTVENQKPDANGNIQIFNRKLTPYKFLTGNNNNFVFDSTNQTYYVNSVINSTSYLFKLDFNFNQIKYVALTSGNYYGIKIINNMIYICGTSGIFAYDENLQKQYSYSINGVYFYKIFSSTKCLYVTAGDNNVYKMTFALTYLDKKDFTDGYSPQIVLDPNTGKIYGIAQYHENKLYILNESLQVEKTVSLDIPTIDITIINNSIYIFTNNSLNKLNSSLSVQKQVSFNTTMLDTSSITNDDNSIYFLENQYIHEFDFDLNEKSKTSFFSDSFSIQNINNDYICAMYNQSITNRPLVMLKKNASLIDAIEGIYNYLF